MAVQPVIDTGLPTVPPDPSNQATLTPKTHTPAITAGGEGGVESASENTTVSDTGTVPGGNLQFGSKYKRRLSNSSQVNLENLENVANKNPTNVRFPKGAHARLRL
jgi:hypothetical protein